MKQAIGCSQGDNGLVTLNMWHANKQGRVLNSLMLDSKMLPNKRVYRRPHLDYIHDKALMD